jgi:hypothetical protein
MVHTCGPSYEEGIGRRIRGSEASPKQKCRAYLKKNKRLGVWFKW